MRRFQDWRERDEIIEDLQRGRYTVGETLRRLDQHAQPGGSERVHVFSCRNGFLACRCPFKFDRTELVSLA